MAYKVLICDQLPAYAAKRFEDAGFEVTTKTGMDSDELLATLPGYHAAIIRSATKVREPHIDAAIDTLKVVIRGGVGIDNIDHEYARSKGVSIRNTPAATSNSVAELALGLMLSLARHIVKGTTTLKNGDWAKKKLKGTEIAGKTLGLIGVGRIGACLAEKCMALGMSVVAYDKYVKESPMEGITMMELDDVLAKADYISLHIPFDKKVGATIGADQFAKMKDGVYLVNCARGGTVDEDAMLAALDSGKLAGAGLDVFVGEPEPRADVVGHEKVICTPHIGASAVEGQDRIVDIVEEILKEELV
jgi:D-3-phosphoglycerate dehydrogenase